MVLYSVLWQEEVTLHLTMRESRCDRQCMSKQRGFPPVLLEKRMINLLIIVLRAVVAVANALIAILELIRQFID